MVLWLLFIEIINTSYFIIKNSNQHFKYLGEVLASIIYSTMSTLGAMYYLYILYIILYMCVYTAPPLPHLLIVKPIMQPILQPIPHICNIIVI